MKERVLIVKVSGLGAVVHSLPVLDYLRQVSPGCQVDWLVDEECRGLLEGNPLINRLHVARSRVWRRRPLYPASVREMGELKRQLRECQFDLAFDLQGDLASGLLMALSGVPDRVGFDRDNLQDVVNLLFTTRQVPGRRVDQHVTDQCLRVVSVPFGKDFRDLRLASDIWTSKEDDAVADALMATLGEGFVFLFQQGAGWQTKQWHEAGWIDLGKRLLSAFSGATILLAWGTEGERESVLRLGAAIGPGARVMDRFPLKTLTAVLKRVDLVVGPDTGPVHIAAAVGTPTVSFYRASDGRRSGPRGERHVVVQASMECSRCLRTSCDRDQDCRESIGAEILFRGIQRLMVPAPSPGPGSP
jgi:heptosyltransferase-1